MKQIIKPLLGNGKKALVTGADLAVKTAKRKNGKNGLLKNGLNGNGNGNGNGLAGDYAKAQRAKAKQSTFVPEPEAGYVEPSIDLAKVYARDTVDKLRVTNTRRPGGVNRANRPTRNTPAHSLIFTESEGMKEAYPEIHGEIDSWVRGGYAYARDKTTGTPTQPLKDYPPFIGPDGRQWRLKPKQRYGQGYRLSAIDKGKLKGYSDVRRSREKPWTLPDQRALILRALTKVGKAHKFEQLMKIMKSDFYKGMDEIKASGPNMSKGHLISLDNGGLDVKENFMPQQFRNRTKMVDGKKVVIKGNPAMQADSTTEFASGRGVSSWDAYVRLKLHLL